MQLPPFPQFASRFLSLSLSLFPEPLSHQQLSLLTGQWGHLVPLELPFMDLHSLVLHHSHPASKHPSPLLPLSRQPWPAPPLSPLSHPPLDPPLDGFLLIL